MTEIDRDVLARCLLGGTCDFQVTSNEMYLQAIVYVRYPVGALGSLSVSYSEIFIIA